MAVGGIGVYGGHQSSLGTDPGVLGETDSTESGAVGVLGRATSTVGTSSYGVYGESAGQLGTGVYGTGHFGVRGHTNSAFGVWGHSDNGEAFAGYFTGSKSYFEGNVGIGTTDPNHELVVQGDDPAMQIRDDATDNSANAARFELLERAGGNFDGGSFFWWNGETNKLLLGTKVGGVNTNVLVIDRATNNVGIGTQDPGNYRLAVNGSIRAKEIVVEAGWSDFVFEPDYKLQSLEQVEAYIREHGHLPDIPSAKDVAEHGVKVGEVESKLLQKIEELTLHLIEMNKRVQALERENARLTRGSDPCP
jgi:hypothetical protein